ncbi:MAG: hypothetical protein ACPHCI_10090 [Solirubrobacterales bacterium]
MASLVEKLHEIHESLAHANLAHAFGGAIALAFCTMEPRGTRDLDVNIFIDAEQAERATTALPTQIACTAHDLKALRASGQARLWWDDTPIDLFLNNHPFHEEVARGVRWVPLGGRDVPVLGCESLVIFKALFDRTKDWADIEAVADADRDCILAASDRLAQLTKDESDPAVLRLQSVAG